MSSPKVWAVWPLLDAAFGFFVWAAHLLAIYVTIATGCVLGLGTASAASRTTFVAVLVMFTVIATAVVVFHGLRRYRQQRTVSELRFRMAITIGNDAIAGVAIAWQLLAIFLVPACI